VHTKGPRETRRPRVDPTDPPIYTRGMGKIIVEQIVTADGFGAEKDGSITCFEQDTALDETALDQLEMLKGVDAIMLGANTYKMFIDYWPTEKAGAEPSELTTFINTKPKHIFSRSLKAAPWGKHQPAIVESGDLPKTVASLRERYRGDVIMWGSLALAEEMFRAKLVDVLRLRCVPVLIGQGKPIAPTGTIQLALDSAKSYPMGHVVTQYRVL
jgi:dihydrofolate reductase